MSRSYWETVKGLENRLTANDKEPDIVRRLAKNIRLARAAMDEVVADRNFMARYFLEEAVQIECNKELFPALLSKYIFLRKYLALEMSRLYATEETARQFCESELARIGQFFSVHKEFCEYFFSGDTTEDQRWYTSLNTENPALDLSEPIPFPFHHPGCRLKSMLVAYQEYRPLLRALTTVNSNRSQEKITFQGSQVDLVEILLALYEAESVFVDGRPAGQGFLFQRVASIFSNIDASGLEGLVKNVRNRKGGAAKFLYRLINALEDRMSRAFTEEPRKRPLNPKRLT